MPAKPPLYIARRVVRMAIEDIGLADPQALVVANAAKDAYDFLGSPEGELAIAQAVIYVATAPKSNAAYTAFGAAKRAAKEGGSLLPPKHILNAPTKLMKEEGYGRGYAYDHDQEEAFSGQDYFPEKLGRQQFYDPPERGFEREIRKRLEYWAKLRKERRRLVSIDLDAYFKRVGYTGDRKPTLATLRELHRRQPQAIAFENLSPMMGQAVPIDAPSLHSKMVAGGRGGYCYEQNLLFASVLEALGFKFRHLTGWPRWQLPPGTPFAAHPSAAAH